MKFAKQLSIIIVNYNGAAYLKGCIAAIVKHGADLDFEIIVVDNKSSDNSMSILNKISGINVIEHVENSGFAKGNNIGVKQAKGEFLLLLNNDTILLDQIKPLMAFFKDEKIGALGIKMLNGQKEFVPSFGRFPKPITLIKLSLLNYGANFIKQRILQKEVVEVEWISGSFFLLKKEVWEELDGFDEDYFMYVEDVDLCKRIRKLGKKTLFIPGSNYIHFVGFNKRRERFLIDGYRLFANKHFNTFGKVLAKSCLYLNYAFKRLLKNLH